MEGQEGGEAGHEGGEDHLGRGLRVRMPGRGGRGHVVVQRRRGLRRRRRGGGGSDGGGGRAGRDDGVGRRARRDDHGGRCGGREGAGLGAQVAADGRGAEVSGAGVGAAGGWRRERSGRGLAAARVHDAGLAWCACGVWGSMGVEAGIVGSV